MIEWKRPRYNKTELFRRTVYESHCGRFRIEHLRSLFNLPDRVLVIVDGRIASRHRRPRAAIRQAERLAKREIESQQGSKSADFVAR